MGKKARNRNRAARQSDQPLFVTWKGQTYRVADRIGDAALMDFAEVAEQGVDSNEMKGLAAMKALLRSCLTTEDFARFWRQVHETRAQSDEIMELVHDTYAAVSGRPTKRPSDSSDGQQPTPVSSEAGSSSPVLRVLDSIPPERGDLKLAVWQSQQTG